MSLKCQKLVVLWPVSRNILHRKFHSLGPSTENSRKPHEFRRYNGKTSWWPAAERRWCLCAISETETQYSGVQLSAWRVDHVSTSLWQSQPSPSTHSDLAVPTTRTGHYGPRSFAVVGSSTENPLPVSLCEHSLPYSSFCRNWKLSFWAQQTPHRHILTVITFRVAEHKFTIHTYIHTYKGSVTCAILCLGWVFGVFQFSTAKSREPILAQNIFNWRASGHECAFEVVKTTLTFSIVFVTKNVIWADFVESFFPIVKCERCRDFWRTLLWRNRRRYRLFSEHLILSWCYPPCRMSTRGNGSVTDSVSVSTPVCRTVGHLLQLVCSWFCCVLTWFIHFGVLDKIVSRWHWRLTVTTVCSLLLLHRQKRHYGVFCCWPHIP